MSARSLATAFVLAVAAASPALAQDAVQSLARAGIAYLTASGEPTSGDNIGQPGGVQSQATGFFVGPDGFLLTADHFFEPLIKAGAVNVVIEAHVGDARAPAVPVAFVSHLPDVDLALFRADFPFGTPQPAGMEIASTADLTPDGGTRFLTSGFSGQNYIRRAGDLTEDESALVPYAWTLDMKTDAGQSGSPVYIAGPSGQPQVVGVIKGTVAADDQLTLMIPIEYAMPLIGHFKIAALEREVARLEGLEAKVARLSKIVGEISDQKPPLGIRVDGIEKDVSQISRYFTWRIETLPNGALRVTYNKLVAGNDQIDRISLSLGVKVLTKGERGETVTPSFPTMLALNDNQNLFDRSQLDDSHLSGSFVIPNVQSVIATLVAAQFGHVGGDHPIAPMEIKIIPFIGTDRLDDIPMTVAANYDFNLAN